MNTQISKPRQVVYFEYIVLPTADQGDCFLFFALDHYSEFAFQLGITTEIGTDAFLSKIKELMNDKEFKRHSCAFELVTYRGEHLEKEINDILRPHKGKVKFSQSRVEKKIIPFVEAVFKGLGK